MINIVISGRNDLHGGISFEQKINAILERNVALFQKYDLQYLFWFIEWGKEPGKDWLSPKLVSRFENCRCIQVPDEFVAAAQVHPVRFQEFTAKNIGIARAASGLVIATNSDIIFSEALIRQLKNLVPDDCSFYRSPRYDFACDVKIPDHESEFRITARYELDKNLCEASGDFFAATPKAWKLIQGYSESPHHVRHLDSEAVVRAKSIGLKPVILAPIFHREHPDSTKFSASWKPEWGEQDSGLSSGTKIMPRNAVWGQRHCKFTVQGERLFLLENNGWDTACEKVARPDNEHRGQPMDVLEEKSITIENPRELYLSVVVAARNDDYDSNMLHRMQVFTDGLAAQCKRFNLNAELIVVEWNPPPDKKRLYEVLEWPDDLGPLTVRFIEVPAEIHNSIGNSDKIPFFQMTAKNVGVRRARGKFVLATNIDVLFSDELMQFLAGRQLEENCFYRNDRYDVGCKTMPPGTGIKEQLEFCQNNIVRINTIEGTKSVSEFEQWRPNNLIAQTEMHIHACGDFTLMTREKWHLLRGYPEIPLWSIFVDGLILHMAHSIGMRQVILPTQMKIYHLDHDMSWGICSEDKKRFLMSKYPSLDFNKDYLPWCQRMAAEKRPITDNDANWGYITHSLKEHTIGEKCKEQPIIGNDANWDYTTHSLKEHTIGEKRQKRPGLTIFALPKAFKGQSAIIQRNAIKSWTLLSPRPEIILMGNDAGVAQYAAEMSFRHIPDVRKNEFGTPLVSDLFARAQDAASNDVLMYINSDIILMDDFMVALGNVRQRFDEFLMVGQRWNTPIANEIDFGVARWREQLQEFVCQNSVLFATCGIDYFVFTHGFWPAIPDFGIGRSAWDNWLVWKPIDEGKVVVDATDVVMAIHQDHEYIPSPSKLNEEAKNRSMCEDAQLFGFTSSAAWKCTRLGVVMRNAGEFLQNNYMMPERAFMYIGKSLPHDPHTVERDCRHAMACMSPELLKIFADGAKDLLSKQPHQSGAAMVMKCITEKSCSIGNVVLQRGTEYLRYGHPEEALKWLDVLIGLDVPNLNYARAVALSQLGKYGSARQACLDELKLQSDHDDTRILLGQIDAEFQKEANELCIRGLSKMQNGDFVAALADFESAALRCFAAPLPNLNYAKAVALSRIGKYGSARQACLEELKFQPGHVRASEMLERLNRAINEYNASKGKVESKTETGASHLLKECV